MATCPTRAHSSILKPCVLETVHTAALYHDSVASHLEVRLAHLGVTGRLLFLYFAFLGNKFRVIYLFPKT